MPLMTFVPATGGPVDDLIFRILVGMFLLAAAILLLRGRPRDLRRLRVRWRWMRREYTDASRSGYS